MPSTSSPLFRAASDSGDEPPLAKKPRFFEDSDSEDDQAFILVEEPHRPVAGPSNSRNLDLDDPGIKAGAAGNRAKVDDWEARYFGDVIIEGYALASSSAFVKLKIGDPVTLHRVKPAAASFEGKDGHKKSAAALKKLENDVVRYKNANGVEVGRVSKRDSAWLAKLIDLDLLRITGFCAEVKDNFRSGEDMRLILSISIAKSAFTNPNTSGPEPMSHLTSVAAKKSFIDDLKETDREKLLRERKVALNKLFDKTDLQPLVDEESSGRVSALPGSTQSKRAMLENMEKRKNGEGDVEEEDEMNEIQLNLVYSKATKNDANLPEMDPPDTFALNLRPYQKQALKWMSAMETGEENARKSLSMHPLWEKYLFPGSTENSDCFYYNPYSGELSLEFPKASTKCRGGILADEMGLGKTIMVASLIHTINPWNSVPSSDEEPSNHDSDSSLEFEKPVQAQSRLGVDFSKAPSSSIPKRPRLKVGTPRATLVVAPMTLLSQWCDELERSSKKGKLRVLMYYGAKRGTGKGLQEEIDGGVDVIITSYGTLCSDFKQSGLAKEDSGKASKENAKPSNSIKEKDKSKAKGKGKADEKSKTKKKKLKGLFAVEWFRVILDEAHLIKSRTTFNAKASYALKAARRWALTGTPIVNRLEDLYSLLHFIQLEPWGNFSFFKTFITVPFQNKDPRAIEVIQVILESILLRREKKMKDKNGRPIVSLPEKHVDVVHLDFTPEEREIYDALYRNAKSKFLGYAAEGSVLQNVTAIFSILMRLRQAVLHPTLVLKRLKENLAAKGKALTSDDDDELALVGDLDESAIQKLIERYSATKEGTYASGVLRELLEPKAEGDGGEGECMLCMEPVEIPVWLPRCWHSGCKGCVLQHFLDCQEAGEEPRCPVCSSGPLSERDIYHLQNSDGTKPAQSSASGRSTAKKANYAVETVMSSPGSSSTKEVLTILDSDEENDEPLDKSDSKGKSKAKIKEITLDSDDDERPESDSDGSSDDYAPRNGRDGGNDEEEEEEGLGDLGTSDDEGESKRALLAKADFRSSTKLEALVKSLKAAREKDPLLKAVVFSQFTGFLDLIERVMNRESFSNLRLDGTMSQSTRQKVVRKFTKTDKSAILLASLKAGGVGLNLVASNHVYLMDAWWNSAIEMQAIDRIHRFGQTREVFVTRFLINQTIDDKMIALQERKTRVIQGALGGKAGKDKKQLAEDLAMIFED
ncbi:hypothetical protein JCM1841_000379 [Sporobolomyces salmonicolor]